MRKISDFESKGVVNEKTRVHINFNNDFVNRKLKDEELSKNNYLKSLNIPKYSINFDKETSVYSLKIKDEKSLDIVAVAEDENADVKINGNRNLKNGSKIEIQVKSESGEVRSYLLNIKKSNSTTIKIVLIVICSVLIICALVAGLVLIIKSKKSKALSADILSKN